MTATVAPRFSVLTEKQAATRRLDELRVQAQRFQHLAERAEQERAEMRQTGQDLPQWRMSQAEDAVELYRQSAMNAERILRDAEHFFSVHHGTISDRVRDGPYERHTAPVSDERMMKHSWCHSEEREP